MSAVLTCRCGRTFLAADDTSECPECRNGADATFDDLVDNAWESDRAKSPLARMFEALLDPQAIRWLLVLGGTLSVIGLVVWLISIRVFENPINQAIAFAFGTAALFGAGWWLSLFTRFRLAGDAVTFLAAVVAPLNLWFYHAQKLLTIDGHLWIAGVVCCVLYAATLVVLRRPLFLYAFQAGVTLTGLLFLADLKSLAVIDAALLFAVLGAIAIHLERAFPPVGEFDRRRFGPPLLWTGLAQFAIVLAATLPLQIVAWADLPTFAVAWLIDPSKLAVAPLVATGLWLAAAYSTFYVAMVPRFARSWTTLAACGCLLMAETTLLINADAPAEGSVVALALTAAIACVAAAKSVERDLTPRHAALTSAVVMSGLPLVLGYLLFARGVMPSFRAFGWFRPFDAAYPLSMTLTAACMAASAIALRGERRYAAVLRFLTAGSVLLATAGAVRIVEMPWSIGAAILTLIPIAYLVEGMLRKDDVDVSIAYTAFGVFSASAFLAVCHQGLDLFIPIAGKAATLGTAIVALESTVFLLMAASRSERLRNTFASNALAVGAAGTLAIMFWQGLGYLGAGAAYTVPAFAGSAVISLAISRMSEGRSLARPAFVLGALVLLTTALLGDLRSVAPLLNGELLWRHASDVATIALAAFAAAGLAAQAGWRRFFVVVAAASVALDALLIAGLAELSPWQRLEALAVTAGLMLLVTGHVARFRETLNRPNDLVDAALWIGSVLATLPLAIAMLSHRIASGDPSLADELILTTIGVLMLATGLSWRLKATTLLGGLSFGGYLVVLVASALRHPELTMGAYLVAIGLAVFATGIALSIYRERLLMLPERIAKREGVFQVLDWR
jgi:hypothetical protein